MKLQFTPEEVGSESFNGTVEALLRIHRRAALTVSGGRDSMAMYHALSPFLDRLTVVWVNSGNLFPEILEYMSEVRAKTPNFVEIKTDQPSYIKENGYPADVLPVDYTNFGASCTEGKDIKLSAYLDCCGHNISIPMYNYIKENRFSIVFRGNRRSESHRSPGENGDVQEGVRFLSLIYDWTDDQVLKFLERNGEEILPRFKLGHSSLDCMNCTAFTRHSLDRMRYIKEHHPRTFDTLKPIFMKIERAIKKESEGVEQILLM